MVACPQPGDEDSEKLWYIVTYIHMLHEDGMKKVIMFSLEKRWFGGGVGAKQYDCL